MTDPVKNFSMAVCLALLVVALPPGARADEWNKKTILTVNEPIAVPGKVLQPGKYMMKLVDSPSNRHIVQIYNEDGSQLQTTVLAIPNYRTQPTGKSQFGFWEMPAGSPPALRSWFYPGDNFGQEFAYPKDMAVKIANATKQNVQAIVSGDNNLASAEVKEVTPGEQNDQQSASAQPPASTPAPAPEPATPPAQTQASTSPEPATPPSSTATAPSTTAPEPAPAQPRTATSTGTNRLPSTGSPFPLVGLGGLLSVGSALLIRVARRRNS